MRQKKLKVTNAAGRNWAYPEMIKSFWPINEGLTNEILKFIHLFACVDPDELEVSGGQGTGERIEVQVDLLKCFGHDYCKPDQEIEIFFARQTMFLMKNAIRFDQQ